MAFTIPEFAGVHASPFFRPALFGLLLAAFSFAFLSRVLREGKAPGMAGMAANSIAVMLGGPSAQGGGPGHDSPPFWSWISLCGASCSPV